MAISPGDLALLLGGAIGAFSVGAGVGWLVSTRGKGNGKEKEKKQSLFEELHKKGEEPRPALLGTASDFEGWKERRLVDELQDENTELKNLFTLLPGLTRRMTETLDRREIARILCDMVRRLCIPPPDKVIVFLLVGERRRELALAASDGYHTDRVFEGLRIPVDGGMFATALRRQTTVEVKEGQTPGGSGVLLPFSSEIAAPLVHNRRVLGLISVEGLPETSRFAKRMVSVAANLGGLALANAEFVGQIQRLADADALTGLYNKRYFFEHFEAALDEAKRQTKPLCLFMFDLDHFKAYNDRNGHQAGDEALRTTGKLLRDMLGDEQLAARYGGEEFVVVLPDTKIREARRFAEQMRAAINESRVAFADTQPLGMLSISGGIACFPDNGDSCTSLIEYADANLYRAKKAGRNRIF